MSDWQVKFGDRPWQTCKVEFFDLSNEVPDRRVIVGGDIVWGNDHQTQIRTMDLAEYYEVELTHLRSNMSSFEAEGFLRKRPLLETSAITFTEVNFDLYNAFDRTDPLVLVPANSQLELNEWLLFVKQGNPQYDLESSELNPSQQISVKKRGGAAFSIREFYELELFLGFAINFFARQFTFKSNRVGTLGSKVVWQDRSSYGGAPKNFAPSYFNIVDKSFKELLESIYSFCQDENDRIVLYRLLKLFFASEQAMTPKYADERVLILQSSLELASWTICQNRADLLDDVAFDKLNLDQRLHMLLAYLKVKNKLDSYYSPSFRYQYPSPMKGQPTGEYSASKAFSVVRNNLVHPKYKKGMAKPDEFHTLSALSDYAATWGHEVLLVSILHLIGYKGRFQDFGCLFSDDPDSYASLF